MIEYFYYLEGLGNNHQHCQETNSYYAAKDIYHISNKTFKAYYCKIKLQYLLLFPQFSAVFCCLLFLLMADYSLSSNCSCSWYF